MYFDVVFRDEFYRCSRMVQSDNEKVIDAWVLQGSGSKLDLKAQSLVKGKRAHLILRQDGNLNTGHSTRVRSGLWTGGFQHFSSFNIEALPGHLSCKKYVRRPWYIYRDYDGLSRIDFVPPDAMGACIALQSNGQMEILLTIVISHSMMWPSGRRAASYTFEASRNSVARVESNLGDTYVKVTGADASFSFAGETLTARIVMDGTVFLSIGSDVNFDPAAAFQQAENYYAAVTRNCVLQSSSSRLDKAFFWSKIAILESYSETEVGNGFFAGFPEFSWFFGRDGLWTSFAAYIIGLHEEADSHIAMLWDNSLDGRIPHEVPIIAGHDSEQDYEVSGISGIRTRYMSIDSTPLWVVAQGYKKAWSGHHVDMTAVEKAMIFLRSLDKDGDGLIENAFSEGLIGWPEKWASSRDGACIEINSWYIEALKASGFLLDRHPGGIEGIQESFDENFLSNDDPYFFDSVYSGKRRKIISPMGSVPGMYVKNDHVKKILGRLSEPDVLTEAGIRSMSSKDPMYDRGYHTGQIWPLMTGWHAIAAYNNEMSEIGERCIWSFVDLSFSAPDPGRINEVYDPEFYEPRGQFAQVWSHALFIMSIMEGMLNMLPSWRNGKSPVEPSKANLPIGMAFLRVDRVKLRDSFYTVMATADGLISVSAESGE